MQNSISNAWPMTRCDCGAIRVQFDRVTIHVTEEELLQLADGIYEVLYRNEHQDGPMPLGPETVPLDVTKH